MKFKLNEKIRRVDGGLAFTVSGTPDTCYLYPGKIPAYTITNSDLGSAQQGGVAVYSQGDLEAQFEPVSAVPEVAVEYGGWTPQNTGNQKNAHPHATLIGHYCGDRSLGVWTFTGRDWVGINPELMFADELGRRTFWVGDKPTAKPVPMVRFDGEWIPRAEIKSPPIDTNIFLMDHFGAYFSTQWVASVGQIKRFMRGHVYLDEACVKLASEKISNRIVAAMQQTPVHMFIAQPGEVTL